MSSPGKSSSSDCGSTTAPEKPWLPISPPFSITMTESSLPAACGELAQADRAGQTGRAAADEQDVDFEAIALSHRSRPFAAVSRS